ncbi:transposase [Pseudomonas putida]|uniref:transposase n=1 Tax=Pseudomonas putida TaxID=303 RepID=UPI0020CC732C|nr:transposase [Pseudomonas putida]
MDPQRRNYTETFKAEVIQECSEPGAFLGNIALDYSLNASRVPKWIRLHNQKTTAIQLSFITLHPQMLGAGSNTQPSSIRPEIHHPRTLLRMIWPVDSAAACASFLRELFR